jgi:hypothetical protein
MFFLRELEVCTKKMDHLTSDIQEIQKSLHSNLNLLNKKKTKALLLIKFSI